MKNRSIWPILLSVSIMTATGLANKSYAAEENLPAKDQVVEESKEVLKEEGKKDNSQDQTLSKVETELQNQGEAKNSTGSPDAEEKENKETEEGRQEPKEEISSKTPSGEEAKEEKPQAKETPQGPNEENSSDQETEKMTQKSAKAPRIMEAGGERSANPDLEISDQVVPEAQKESQPIEINSWEDLKGQLEFKEDGELQTPDEDNKEKYNYRRLEFKENNYKLTKDITIDLGDDFFKHKEEYIKEGILSNSTSEENIAKESFSFDGSGHTITLKPKEGGKAGPLFGRIVAKKVDIKDLNLKVEGDVYGAPFADKIYAQTSKVNDSSKDLTVCQGNISNIGIEVIGSINGMETIWGSHRMANNNFTGNPNGIVASGFAIGLTDVLVSKVNIKVNGNIESDYTKTSDEFKKKIKASQKASSEDTIAMAYGFVYNPKVSVYGGGKKAEKEIFENNNPEILKKYGLYQNIKIEVVGSIKSTSQGCAYATGFTNSTDNLWLDNIHVKASSIETVTKNKVDGKLPNHFQSVAAGFTEDLSVLENSTIEVDEIKMDCEPDKSTDSSQLNEHLASVFGIGENNEVGRYTKVSNNNIKIGKINVVSNGSINACSAFQNFSLNPVKYQQIYENNKITIGDIDLTSKTIAETGSIRYTGLGAEFRKGKNDKLKLNEVSAKGNELTVGDFKVVNKSGENRIFLGFDNAANAKNNTISYGDVSIKSDGKTFFKGLGDLIYRQNNVDNGVDEITEGNKLAVGDLTIDTKDITGGIGLLTGFVHNNKTGINNVARYGEVKIKIKSPSSAHMIGGISYANLGKLYNNHIYMKDFKVEISDNQNKSLFISPGISRNYGEVKNSTVFVNKDISVEDKKDIDHWVGGFFATSSTDNPTIIENCHVQVGGEFKNPKKTYGAFASFVKNCTIKDSSALVFNGFVPFAYKLVGGGFDRIAHYITSQVPQYFGGLLSTSGKLGEKLPSIKNSTLISDYLKEDKLKDPVAFRDDIVDQDESKNNYIVFVGRQDEDEFSRKAYKLEKKKAKNYEMEDTEVDVWRKGAEVGKISIAQRAFQDKYWGGKAQFHDHAAEEKDFPYVIKNPGTLKFKHFGFGENKI
uniref:hypothetical protein n=1 Tax=uncultured Anaerococcus sp. TaxID=293428 RepID=UPI0028891C0E